MEPHGKSVEDKPSAKESKVKDYPDDSGGGTITFKYDSIAVRNLILKAIDESFTRVIGDITQIVIDDLTKKGNE